MKALLIYPRFPDTYWGFKHALSFQGKRPAQPPLGLMTVAALLPKDWQKRLVDCNVEPLEEGDLAWADIALVSGMHIQREQLISIVERCRSRDLPTVVGGSIASSPERNFSQRRWRDTGSWMPAMGIPPLLRYCYHDGSVGISLPVDDPAVDGDKVMNGSNQC